jgi:hypothetical protein
MKRFSIGCLIAVFLLAPAMAEEVPFATPPYQNRSDTAVSTLANIMATVQLRHIKLWSAGKAKNWDVVNYEAQKLEADFVTAAGYYGGLPIEFVVRANTPLKRIMEAAKARDYPAYTKAFDELTAGCNGCHAAGQVGFIRIQTPRSSPFSDQNFER